MLSLTYNAQISAFQAGLDRAALIMSTAIQIAAQDTAKELQRVGQQAMTGGLARWRRNVTVEVLPGRSSMEVTINAYLRNPGFIRVFDIGATIAPTKAKYLWLALPTVPNKYDTPKRFIARTGIPLILMKIAGDSRYSGKPLLGAYFVGDSPLLKSGKISLTALKRGVRKPRKGQEKHLVPLFVGISQDKIAARLNLNATWAAIGALRFNTYYVQQVANYISNNL